MVAPVVTNNFDYHNIRAKKARLGNQLNKWYMKFLTGLMLIAAFGGGIYLLAVGQPLGWFLIGVFCTIFTFAIYAKLELFKVPSGKTEDLNDILSHNVIANLDKVPTPRKIARVIMKTNSGRFLAHRFGITVDLLDSIAMQMGGDDPTPIFLKARELREQLGSMQISGGILAVAMIECLPAYDILLGKMKLEINDLYRGVTWYNYLNGIVRDAKKKPHTGGIARDFSFGYIPTLQHFGRNISATLGGAVKTKINQASHQEIIQRMIETFAGGGRKNIALIGPDGSGRSTIVNAFAEELLDADSKLVPNTIRFHQVFMLDASTLISAANAPGELEGLIDRVLGEAYDAKNIIVYLDNAHLFFEEGTGSVDISNLLIPILENGALRMILTLDEQRFLEISARKPALSNALNKIMVTPANEEETMKVMEDQVPQLEYQHKVIYTFWALKEAYRLSARYIHDLEMPGRALNLLESAAKYANGGYVLAESVQTAIEKTQGVKVSVAEDTNERDKLLNLETLIHERMIDQVEAVKTVSDALRRAAAGVRNSERPIGTFLFLGPTGVGKTELAKALSEVYFGGESQLVRVDLNEFVSADDVSRLIADGADDPMSLTAQVMKQPFSVVLLDEIEKAHSSVLTTLLQMLDEGVLRDIRGREVSFKDSIVIMTSNAAADVIRNTVGAGAAIDKEALVNHLISSGQFKPEFLNRFDEICCFKPLGIPELTKVLDLIIASVNKTLAPQKISVTLDDGAKQILVQRGYDPQLGARPMRRIVQKTVENLVAKSVLSGAVSAGANITITAQMVMEQL